MAAVHDMVLPVLTASTVVVDSFMVLGSRHLSFMVPFLFRPRN